jgi:hypothetical protein
MNVGRRTAFLIVALCTRCLFALQHDSSTAHVEELIRRLGTGNIRDEDAAKTELRQHPSAEALPIILKALPASDAIVRDDIVDILDSYKDNSKIPALLAYKANGWGEKNVDSQLVELRAPAVDALVKSLPETCNPGSRNSGYADWVGTVLREIEPEGTRAMLAGLMTQQSCVHEAARSGLVVPRPGPTMAPPATTEEQEMRAGLFLLVDAAEIDDPDIQETAVKWIRSLQSRGWPDLEYAEFLDSIIEAYRSNMSVQTRTEIARLLALHPCHRVDRFMRSAMNSPVAEVRTIARQYLRPNQVSK